MTAGHRYELQFTPAAERSLRKLEPQIRRRIVRALAELTTNPRPAGAKALTGHPGVLRHRLGDHRIVYTVDDGRITIVVLDIGHRREIYRTW